MNKSKIHDADNDLIFVPVADFACKPQLTEAERSQLLFSIREAAADVIMTRFTPLTPGELEAWLFHFLASWRERRMS